MRSVDLNHNSILISFRNGEEEGFNYFFRLYYKAVCFFASRYLNDLATAEDVVSDAYVQLWASREKIESEDHLRNWLYRSVCHLCLDHLQKIKTKEKYLASLGNEAAWAENEYVENIIRSETARLLNHTIESLPAQCKKIFQKLYFEGKSVKDVAAELGLTISTINNQKSRGIKLLRGKFTSLLLICISLLQRF